MNSTYSTPNEILKAALAKEQQAHDFYARLADSCHVEMVRDLLNKLKDEESKHVHMIQDILVRLSLGQGPR